MNIALNYFSKENNQINLRVEEFNENAINNLKFEEIVYSLNNKNEENIQNYGRRTLRDSDMRNDRYNIGNTFGCKIFFLNFP